MRRSTCLAVALCAATPLLSGCTPADAGRAAEAARAALPDNVTAYGHLSDTVVHLASGDSVELQASGPAVVADGAPGLLVTYFPFAGLADTVHVGRNAVELFAALRPSIGAAPFVALRAVDVRAGARRRAGAYQMNTFGVVLERCGGGWCRGGAPIPD